MYCLDSNALDAIAALMSGTEWEASTLDDIAEIVRSTGRVIDDVAPFDPAIQDY
jgi:hypothetical protein